MRLEADDVLALRAADPPGLQKALRLSVIVHVVVTIALFATPREWLSTSRVEPIRMTISLGDGSGARTSGRTPAGGRTVEQVAPPERRPEPVRPAGARQNVMTIPETTTQRPPPKPTEATTPPPSPVTRAPAPGREIARGTAATETGNVGESAGLASGGERGGQRADFDVDFCCPEWGRMMVDAIDKNWAGVQPERGVTILSFVVTQNGIDKSTIKVEQSSGSSNLDRLAEFAVRAALIPPLPRAYTEPTLRVRLRFPYGMQ